MTRLIGIGVALLLVVRGVQPVLRSAPVLGADARFYYAAARAVLDGTPLSAIEGWLYPPPLAIVLAPFGDLPFPVFAADWCILMLLCTFGLAWTLRTWLPLPVSLAAVFLFPPTWQGLYLGQLNPLVAWLMAVAIVAWTAKQDAQTAAWVVLGAFLKIVPAAGVIVIWRSRRGLRMAAGLFAGIVLVTVPFVRLSDWFAAVGALDQTWDHPALCSWTAILARAGLPHADLIAVPVLGATIWRRGRVNRAQALAAAFLVPLLVGRVVWPPSMVLALPSLAVLWSSAPGLTISIWFTFAAACLGTPALDIIMAVAVTIAWIQLLRVQ